MIWQELSIQVPGEFVEPVSYLFGRYGHGLSAEDLGDGQVLMRSYLPNTSRRRLARIEARARAPGAGLFRSDAAPPRVLPDAAQASGRLARHVGEGR